MKYKAIISDIDGTLMPIHPTAKPSLKVQEAVKKAVSKGIYFCLATGRPFSMVEYIIDFLELNSFVITDNGASIYDAKNKKHVWVSLLSNQNASIALKAAQPFKKTIRLSCEGDEVENPLSVRDDLKVRKFSVHGVTVQEADLITKQVQAELKDIAVVKAATFGNAELVDLYITHAEATKQHAVLRVSKLLGVSTKEMIGIGDHHNDFSLLMACGIGVAMGNSLQDLKDIADYIAPPMEEDGVVDVIEKFIL